MLLDEFNQVEFFNSILGNIHLVFREDFFSKGGDFFIEVKSENLQLDEVIEGGREFQNPRNIDDSSQTHQLRVILIVENVLEHSARRGGLQIKQQVFK